MSTHSFERDEIAMRRAAPHLEPGMIERDGTKGHGRLGRVAGFLVKAGPRKRDLRRFLAGGGIARGRLDAADVTIEGAQHRLPILIERARRGLGRSALPFRPERMPATRRTQDGVRGVRTARIGLEGAREGPAAAPPVSLV